VENKDLFTNMFIPSLMWNTNPSQMMSIVDIMMKATKNMDKNSDWNHYFSKIGFILE
jgi:hypothetical protein